MSKHLLTTLFFAVATLTALEQYQNTKVIITGYLPNPNGTDDNYEYVQLMATEHINFSKENYAVIIAHGSNSGSTNPTGTPTNGWATGKISNGTSQTTQFSLTSGEFNAGDYFYVGGLGKKLNGVNSTDISSTANWVRTLDITASGWSGDNNIGGGTFTTGAMFGNSNPVVPQGIAVFAATNVDETTLPVDVVFFGSALSNSTAIGRYYKLDGGTEYGYRICNTDRYNTTDGAFFYKGANTFVFSPTSSGTDNQNVFFKLGGTYNTTTKTWTTPRDVTPITLPTNTTGSLALIETGGTLPISLKFIKADAFGRVIRLNWSTVSESNNAYFEVQHSMDGVKFIAVGKVEGSGTTQVSKQYSFADHVPAMGANYYRLRQVDKDGKFSFSEIVSAKVYFDEKVFTASYANGNIDGSFDNKISARTASVTIFDITGKKIASYKTEITSGNNNFSFKTSLIPGLYVVSLLLGGATHTTKILVTN